MTIVPGFLPQIGPTELIIVLVIVVIIFGPKRIPAAAKSVGRGFRNFKDALGGGDDENDQVEKSDKPETNEIREKTKSGS